MLVLSCEVIWKYYLRINSIKCTFWCWVFYCVDYWGNYNEYSQRVCFCIGWIMLGETKSIFYYYVSFSYLAYNIEQHGALFANGKTEQY